MLRTSVKQLPMPDITALRSTVELERQHQLCSERGGHRSRTKPRAARVGNVTHAHTIQSHKTPGTRVRRVYPRGTRRLVIVTSAMRAVMAGRVFAKARTRGTLCGAGLGIMGKYYASVPQSTMVHAPRLEQWEAPSNSLLRQCSRSISRRHSVLRPSLEIERTTMNCHDERGSVPPVASPPSRSSARKLAFW